MRKEYKSSFLVLVLLFTIYLYTRASPSPPSPPSPPAPTVCKTPAHIEFCNQFISYTAVLTVGNLPLGEAEDEKAMEYYEEFDQVMKRYNCDDRYGYWGCPDCLASYKRWVCAIVFVKCTTTAANVVLPCLAVCNDVVQKCPLSLGFVCPGSDFHPDYGIGNGCNQLDMASSSTVHVFSVCNICMCCAFVLWRFLNYF